MFLNFQGELANGKWLERIETVKFADFQFTLTRHYLHFEETENREVSPPEGENKSSNTGDSDTPFVNNEDDAGNSQVADSKVQEVKDEEEGKEFMIIPITRIFFTILYTSLVDPSGGGGGRQGRAAQYSFHFCSFLRKNWPK